MSELSSIWTKSNCLSRTQLQHYLQHQLDREEEYLVESHLNDCSFCSDALEGLMHVDQEQAAQHLDELKNDFFKKLEAVKPAEKKAKIVSMPTELSDKADALLGRSDKHGGFRWAYAASILLVVGLGYSVFSFIQKYQAKKELSQTTDPTFTSASPTYKAVNDSSMERIHLEVLPEDVNKTRTPELEKAVSEAKKTIAAEERIQEKTIDEGKDRVEMPVPVSAAKEAAPAPEPVVKSEASSADDYREDSKKIESTAKNLSSGKPSGGLKKSSTPQVQAPATNQLNYSSNALQNNNKEEGGYEVSTKEKEQMRDKAGSDYEEALNLYKKGNYRRSIRKLERLLPDSKGARREDILFYLAQCHIKSGNERQAGAYFAQLNESARYGKQAREALRETKK